MPEDLQAECREDGFWAYIDFGGYRKKVLLGESVTEAEYMTVCGKDGTYNIAVNGGSMMYLEPDVAERLMSEGCGQ